MTRYNREFDAQLTPDMVTRWDGLADLTHFDHMGAFWHWARNDGGASIFRDLPLIEGAAEALNQLAVDHNIVIITAKPRWAIHITSKKWEVECNVYVEDSPFQLPNLVARRPDAMVFRFVRAWNEPVDGTHDITSWAELTSLITAAGKQGQ